MRLSERQSKKLRIMCAMLMCVILIMYLFVKPIDRTFSYIQTMSGTCVNTFVGETATKPVEPVDPVEPIEPVGPPDTPDSPGDVPTEGENEKTGDTFNLGIWILLTQVSLLALFVLLFIRSKMTQKVNRR